VRILYVYCHPLPESFHAGIRVKALASLKAVGHEVDLLDLYAEDFNPVLSEDGRRHYHEIPRNRIGLEGYIARLTSAEAIVMQFPTGRAFSNRSWRAIEAKSRASTSAPTPASPIPMSMATSKPSGSNTPSACPPIVSCRSG
jgi:hypothetical protein